MSFATVTRRGFLKGACMLFRGILGIRMTGKRRSCGKSIQGVHGRSYQWRLRCRQTILKKELPKTTRKCGHCTNPISASRSAINRKNCCIPNGLTTRRAQGADRERSIPPIHVTLRSSSHPAIHTMNRLGTLRRNGGA